MIDAPKRIYISPVRSFVWSQEKLEPNEIEYIRADIHEKELREAFEAGWAAYDDAYGTPAKQSLAAFLAQKKGETP